MLDYTSRLSPLEQSINLCTTNYLDYHFNRSQKQIDKEYPQVVAPELPIFASELYKPFKKGPVVDRQNCVAQDTWSPKHLYRPKMPSQFSYKHDFDKHGVFYYIATQGYQTAWQNPDCVLQQVRTFASSILKGRTSDFVGRVVTDLQTYN